MRVVPARDRIIDFRKYKGTMLGTLSSKYLRWMLNNLITADLEIRRKLADDVLEEESGNAVAVELMEMSKRFGWDFDDKVRWGKVDFRLLGTSNGGCLPRVQEKQLQEDSNFKKPSWKAGYSGGVGREKRLEREVKRREHQKVGGPTELFLYPVDLNAGKKDRLSSAQSSAYFSNLIMRPSL
ncbi:hypothetical protein L1887_15604 [Cichorium endivia]|nr:hypothetical protein L1887_15604 [Cichorium endivia]